MSRIFKWLFFFSFSDALEADDHEESLTGRLGQDLQPKTDLIPTGDVNIPLLLDKVNYLVYLSL